MESKKTRIRKALLTDGVVSTVNVRTIRILSGDCINSKWLAAWLANGEEYCQCGFKCKVWIEIKHGRQKPYKYVVDKSELYKLIK